VDFFTGVLIGTSLKLQKTLWD